MDSTFAPGWSILAIMTLRRSRDGGLGQDRDSAKQFIERALALDSNDVRVQNHAGIFRWRTGDDGGALTAFLKAIELRGACYSGACYSMAMVSRPWTPRSVRCLDGAANARPLSSRAHRREPSRDGLEGSATTNGLGSGLPHCAKSAQIVIWISIPSSS